MCRAWLVLQMQGHFGGMVRTSVEVFAGDAKGAVHHWKAAIVSEAGTRMHCIARIRPDQREYRGGVLFAMAVITALYLPLIGKESRHVSH